MSVSSVSKLFKSTQLVWTVISPPLLESSSSSLILLWFALAASRTSSTVRIKPSCPRARRDRVRSEFENRVSLANATAQALPIPLLAPVITTNVFSEIGDDILFHV